MAADLRSRTRIDRLSAVLIDAVLRNYAPHRIGAAARVLAENRIAVQVALRVLTRPAMRRKTDEPGVTIEPHRVKTPSLRET